MNEPGYPVATPVNCTEIKGTPSNTDALCRSSTAVEGAESVQRPQGGIGKPETRATSEFRSVYRLTICIFICICNAITVS